MAVSYTHLIRQGQELLTIAAGVRFDASDRFFVKEVVLVI